MNNWQKIDQLKDTKEGMKASVNAGIKEQMCDWTYELLNGRKVSDLFVGPDWLDEKWVHDLILVFATTNRPERRTACE